MATKEFLVIGLGRFGGGLAETLVGMGHDVLGVDADPKPVQEFSGLLTHVVLPGGGKLGVYQPRHPRPTT